MQVSYQKVSNDFPLITPGKITPGEPILYELDSPYFSTNPLSKFWLRCYNCGLIANLGDHDKVEVKFQMEGVAGYPEKSAYKALITILPSIQCPREGCNAHYHITDSEIK